VLSANPTSAVSIVAILALVVSLGGLAWDVTISVIKRREERAAKKERADLTLTSNGNRTLRFYPFGGHRNPWSTTAFDEYGILSLSKLRIKCCWKCHAATGKETNVLMQSLKDACFNVAMNWR